MKKVMKLEVKAISSGHRLGVVIGKGGAHLSLFLSKITEVRALLSDLSKKSKSKVIDVKWSCLTSRIKILKCQWRHVDQEYIDSMEWNQNSGS